jgi:hypothetical protein
MKYRTKPVVIEAIQCTGEYMKRIEDWILSKLQRRCSHPANMVAADILEGSASNLEVKYCNRCGAVKIFYNSRLGIAKWRIPDPNLWNGNSESANPTYLLRR